MCSSLNLRDIILSAEAFDARTKFVQELRGKIGCGLVNLGGSATANTLAEYYAPLKEDVNNAASFSMDYHKDYHMGFQFNGYWNLWKFSLIYLGVIHVY